MKDYLTLLTTIYIKRRKGGEGLLWDELNKDIVVISSDLFFFSELQEQALAKGLSIQSEPDFFKGEHSVKREGFCPKILLVSSCFFDSKFKGVALLEEFKRSHLGVDTLLGIIFETHDFDERLSLMDKGIDLFLDKEMSPYKIIELCHLELSGKKLSYFNILIYESDPVFGFSLALRLKEMEMHSIVCNNYKELTRKLSTFLPELLIVDLSKDSIVEGIKKLHELVSHYKSLFPIVVSVDSDQELVIEEAYFLGVEDFIIKPVSLQVFSARLANIAQKVALKSVVKEVDPLTGILSRSAFKEHFQIKVNAVVRKKRPFCLALIDLDFFKEVNDLYGHEQGDYVLKKFTQLLSRYTKEEDLLGRWGGEEFTILLKGYSINEGRKLMNFCLEECKKVQFIKSDSKYRLTFSCGIVPLPFIGVKLEELFFSVDKLLYQAKKQGRSCIV